MEDKKMKTTAPVPSVGADGGQPLIQKPTPSIAEDCAENNPPEKDLDEMLRQMQRFSAPAYLPTISMNDLYENVYQSRPPVIDGLLYPGAHLFVGAPKVSKSFLMAQLAYHVGAGLPLWGYPVHQGTVLYLALEDDHRRLQVRLYRMFGTDGINNLYFAIYAKQLGGGLEEQLKWFVQEHPDTRLIIIDTRQKIREAGGDEYSYGNDYDIIGKLKQFADQMGLWLLLVLVYQELFGAALERYNDKQKRSDRKITDYYEHIRTGKQEKLFYEVIFQIGNVKDTAVGRDEAK